MTWPGTPATAGARPTPSPRRTPTAGACTTTALAVADLLSEKGAEVTLNTQDAHIGAEAMRLEIPPFMKRLYERGVKMAVDQELIAAHAEDRQARVMVRNMHTTKSSEYFVDHLVVEAGTLPNDGLFYELKEESANNDILDLDLNLLVKGLAQPEHDAEFHLYRVGDVSGSRDIHCSMRCACALRCSARPILALYALRYCYNNQRCEQRPCRGSKRA